MWAKQVLLVLVLLAGASSAETPMPFYISMQNDAPSDVLFVKNYEAGASLTEAYNNIEKLDRNTKVNTRFYGSGAGCVAGQGSLEASISSNVIGQAHIAWQSVDPMIDSKGRHGTAGQERGRSDRCLLRGEVHSALVQQQPGAGQRGLAAMRLIFSLNLSGHAYFHH